MFQLSLDFFGLPAKRPTAPRIAPVESKEPFLWKHGIAVHFLRRPRARRYLLRLLPDGTARLVIPRRGSQAEALRFLERSEDWLLKQHTLWRSRTRARVPWTDGATFPFRGEPVVLRVVREPGHVRLAFADQDLTLPQQLPDYHAAVLAHLRRLAERELPPRTLALAERHGIKVARVSVRAQRTRWGSCSSRGVISLNWHLIQAPPYVVDYLIVHELMHRREMNHSKRFWALVAEACPTWREAEKWLKATRLDTLA